MIHLLLAVIYMAFISLGLPDGLLGAAWPSMYEGLSVPVSFAGGISMIICMGTIVSSLVSDRLTHRLGAGKVTALSVATTAIALIGFSVSDRYWMLCLWAIPSGLGARSADAARNNYVAPHYSSRLMSGRHCMWGVGASTGPYIIGAILSGGGVWTTGYQIVGILQIILTTIILLSLPLWKKAPASTEEAKPLSLGSTIRIPGAKALMLSFFCYCALEQTAALWTGSYLVLHAGMEPENAAALASLFFLGMTVGRFLGGFLTVKLSDTNMIRLGFTVITLGVAVLLLPLGAFSDLAGLLLIGLGCAPIYPSIIHSIPDLFGAERSQAIIGIQMASAYVGTALMPPLFGLIAEYITIDLLGIFLLLLLTAMTMSHRQVLQSCRKD